MADTQVTQIGKTMDTVCHAGKKQTPQTGRYGTAGDRLGCFLCESAGDGMARWLRVFLSGPCSSFPAL